MNHVQIVSFVNVIIKKKRSNYFDFYIACGKVMSFKNTLILSDPIHLRDVKQIIFKTLIKMNEKPNKFKSHIKKVQAIEQNRIN